MEKTCTLFGNAYTQSELIQELSKVSLEFFELGNLADSDKEEYNRLLSEVESVNGKSNLNGINDKDDNEIKGKALETLVQFIFCNMKELFYVYPNLRTHSNEIDLVVELTAKGECFLASKLENRYNLFLCECKNYKGTVKIDYVEKFYGLLTATNVKLGIFFSWNGLSGKKWDFSKGLIRKVYMLKERDSEKIYIIDFNKEDFYRYKNGESFFEIIKKKVHELQCDVSLNNNISKHDNEDKIVKIVEERKRLEHN